MVSELKQKGIRPVIAWDDGKTIYFVYRDKDKQKRIFEINDFQWYFCIHAKQYESEEGRLILKEAVKKAMTKWFPKLDEVGNKMYREDGRLLFDKISLPNPIKKVEKKGDFVKVYCDRYADETKSFLRRLQDTEIETREADLNLTKRYMIDNMVDIEEDLSILFFDIETNDTNPGIEIGRDEILSWAGCDNVGNVFFEKSDDLETGESELILNMLKLFKKYDLIVGWNSEQFDIAYIKNRIDKLNITGEELGEEKINVNKTNFWKKIIHVDLMKRLIKLFGPMMTVVNLTGFSLNEVAKVFIGEQKIERPEKVIHLYRKNPEKLEEYNKKDVLLVKQINDKLRTLPLMIKECFWTGTFMDRFYIGELLDNYILREANLQDFHLKTRPKYEQNSESIRIRGGYVMVPDIGLYDNVRTLDFKSMYPSIMVGWNIGQESLVEGKISDIAQKDFDLWIKDRKIEEVPFIEWYDFLKKENKKLNPKNKYLQTANNQFFARERPSIISGLVKKLLQERKAYKKQQIDSVYNSIEYKNAQASQEAVKEMSNSMYGITADKQARFFDPRIAEAITMTGQFMNRTTMAILTKMGYQVIYGDTDSIFTLVDSDEEMKRVIDELNKKLSAHLTKTYGFTDNIIYIEYEKKFRKFIMLDKKRYVGHLIEVDGKPVDSVLSKGTENVRKNTIDFTKQKVNECLDLLVKQDKGLEYMKEWVQKIKDYVLSDKMREDMMAKEIPGMPLAITMKLSKPTSAYKTDTPHVKLAKQMVADKEILETHEGKHVWGQKIEYYIKDAHRGNMKSGLRDSERSHSTKSQNAALIRDYAGDHDAKYYWDIQVFAPLGRILNTVWPETKEDKIWTNYTVAEEEKQKRLEEKEKLRKEKQIKKEQLKFERIRIKEEKQKEKETKKKLKETKKINRKTTKSKQLKLF
ncbi:MAG: DNA-directed DNA polymerase [Methanogenium sp.]|jgi:DNA polymerase I